MMFDRHRIRYPGEHNFADFLHAFLARELLDRLSLVARSFPFGVIFSPTTLNLRSIWLEAQTPLVFAVPPGGGTGSVVCDETVPFRRSLPLAISLNALHLSNDPVAMLGELRGALQPDGLFLGAAAASGTLEELAEALLQADAELTGGAAMRIAPFGDVRRWGDGLAKAGFALPVSDEVRVTVRYGGLAPLFRDLRAMGVRGILKQRAPAPKNLFARAEAIYRERHGDADGRLPATFAFACLSGWAPHASQQRAASPGSANVRLEDVLKKFGGD